VGPPLASLIIIYLSWFGFIATWGVMRGIKTY